MVKLSQKSLGILVASLALATMAPVASAALPSSSAEVTLTEIFELPVAANTAEALPMTVPQPALSQKPGAEACPVDYFPCTPEICVACCYEWGGWLGSICAGGGSCFCW